MSVELVWCSFCGKSEKAVRAMVRGPGTVCICDECAELVAEVIVEEIKRTRSPTSNHGGDMTRYREAVEAILEAAREWHADENTCRWCGTQPVSDPAIWPHGKSCPATIARNACEGRPW